MEVRLAACSLQGTCCSCPICFLLLSLTLSRSASQLSHFSSSLSPFSPMLFHTICLPSWLHSLFPFSLLSLSLNMSSFLILSLTFFFLTSVTFFSSTLLCFPFYFLSISLSLSLNMSSFLILSLTFFLSHLCYFLFINSTLFFFLHSTFLLSLSLPSPFSSLTLSQLSEQL